jgi:hypothetical protein
MSHATCITDGPVAVEQMFPSDEEGRLLFVPVIKATYNILDHGRLALSEQQIPVSVGGEHWGKPGESSYKYEADVAFMKPSTDVVLVGSAYAPGARSTQTDVRFSVGPVQKIVRVFGDRYWLRTLGMMLMSPPLPFERIPLVYERAFGGWDRSDPDPETHTCEPRNPVGTGFRSKHGKPEDGAPLPNLENPQYCIQSYGDAPPPAGFGFTSPNWQPRSDFAGTYDDAWKKGRMPLLPKDFDRRFFNGASPGLVASGYLNGDESVLIENASLDGAIAFNLPGVPPPRCRIEMKRAADLHLETKLDTIIVNTDERVLFLVWRAHTILRNGPHDVVSLEVLTGTALRYVAAALGDLP